MYGKQSKGKLLTDDRMLRKASQFSEKTTVGSTKFEHLNRKNTLMGNKPSVSHFKSEFQLKRHNVKQLGNDSHL